MKTGRDQLAVQGGAASVPEGPPDWPPADEEVREALEASFRDGSWGRYHGPNCEALAAVIAELHGVEFATLCCSGTMAVELALRGVGVAPGDEVILAGYDFPGNFRAIEAIGARPVLVDVNRCSACLDVRDLPAARSPRTRAILVSHLHGGLAAMPEIVEFARRHGLAVVEDACQATGAWVAGRRAGCWGDVGVWSFGGSKLLTAGRGGALFTARADVQQRIKIFRERGNDAFPLSELQAAVIGPQLRKLEARHAARRRSVEQLSAQWRTAPGLRMLENQVEGERGYYKLGMIYTAAEVGGVPRDEFLAAVRAEGVALDAGFRGFVRRSEKRCRRVGSLNESRRAAESMLVLHHPVLLEPEDTIARVAAAMEKVVDAFREGGG